MIKAVYFDLDGTLIDIKLAQNRACVVLYHQFGFSDVVDMQAFLKKWDELTEYHYAAYLRRECSYSQQRIYRIVDLFAAFEIPFQHEKALEIYDFYLKAFEDSWTAYSDVLPALEKLKGYHLGIISNGDRVQQMQKLERTGLSSYFEDVVAAGDYSRPKPDVQLFQIVCQKHRIAYHELAYVGDSFDTDMIPCKKLGIHGILLNRNKKPISDPDITIVDSCEQVPYILKDYA